MRPPLACRALIRLASWIAPLHARSAWRSKWDSNLWNWWILFERGELTSRDSAELMRYSWSAFADAFWLRVSRESLRRAVRGPGFVLLTGCAGALAMAAVTHGFRGPRKLFDPLPIQDPGSLVSIQYSGTISEPSGVPPWFVPVEGPKSKLLAGMAGYWRPQGTPRAWVTADFFDLLGVKPALGRGFRRGDANVAVLSSSAWRTLFHGDPGALGKTVESEGKAYTIVGVLPESFWAVSRNIDLWTPMRLDPPMPGLPFLIGAVGRLRPGVSTDAVRAELFDIARDAKLFLPRPPQVAPFNEMPFRPYGPYLYALLFALVSGGLLVARVLPLPTCRGLKGWSFLVSKTLLAVALPLLLWVEIDGVILSGMADDLWRFLLLVALTPAFIFICAFGVWWSFADQRGRCPVCLQLLGLPVSVGSWSSVLEPATTELVCDSGHGSLAYPETDGGL
ncbi:MAG TPA: ABC transporter permease, partial [Bryobacteraceae bacterium]|nr:ABC transporter permease [Bryobacteraceae bacterium]